MKTDRTRSVLILLLNLANFALVTYAVASFFFLLPEAALQRRGSAAFIYFTTDSNILAALASLFVLPFAFRGVKTGSFRIPMGVLLFKYTGTTAVAVTFLTVLLFLGPLYGYPSMYVGANLHLHLICPLFAFFSFLLEKKRGEEGEPVSIRFPETLFGLLPTVIYGAVYYVMVVRLGPEKGGWYDFYGFNRGGLWYLSMGIMFLATWLIALGLRALYNRKKFLYM